MMRRSVPVLLVLIVLGFTLLLHQPIRVSRAQQDQDNKKLIIVPPGTPEELSGPPPILNAAGLADTFNGGAALSAAVATSFGDSAGPNTTPVLLADFDGRENNSADRGGKIADIPGIHQALRVGISEHTVANGFLENVFYNGDGSGNFRIQTDLDPGFALTEIDTTTTINIPQLINTDISGGVALLNPVGGDCASTEMMITGIAVNPVSDLGEFNAALCGISGEVVYVSVLDISPCAMDAGGNPLRTRIFAFGFEDIVGGVAPAGAIQILRSRFHSGGITVDDDSNLYFQLNDPIGLTGAAVFKVTELPRTVCATSPRINRTISSIPNGLNGGINVTQTTVITSGGFRLTNYSGNAGLFGNIVALAAGAGNAIYAATAASQGATGVPAPAQGPFAAPGAFPNGLPSMVMTFADAAGGFDSCSAPAPGFSGVIPIGDGIADPVGPDTTIRWRAFVLGDGPDIRTTTAPLSLVAGTPENTLKIEGFQIDPTAFAGITVDEEGSVYVVSGGTPAGVGNNPSPNLGEILKFQDQSPADRRADYIDFRGNALPPANVGDGDSDRFDHIYWQSPLDGVTSTPTSISGLARGFLRYTNRLAPNAMSAGVTLGQTGGQTVQGDDATTGPIVFEGLDPSHQVAGGDDQTSPFRGDDSDGLGNPGLAAPLEGGFEFVFGAAGSALLCNNSVWNAFFLNSNGNITFAEGSTANFPTVTTFRSGPARIAPAWSDLNPASRGQGFLGSFPVQALGFANINAFKIRWINVPEFAREECSTSSNLGIGGNTLSLTLYDDGTGTDENAMQPLNPANPIGNNAVAFDLQEGPTDLLFRSLTDPLAIVGNPRRSNGTAHFAFDYGRMLFIGAPNQPVLAGYSEGNLAQTNPPGLCELDLGEEARTADDDPFGPHIGRGTESHLFEIFNQGSDGSVDSEGVIFLAVPDFDLRFEGNFAAGSTPFAQNDENRDRLVFFGKSCPTPPVTVLARSRPPVLVAPNQPAVSPGNITGIVNALGSVSLDVLGFDYRANEATIICEGVETTPPGVPVQRAGMTVTTAVQVIADTDNDGIPDLVVPLAGVSPLSSNQIRGALPVGANNTGQVLPQAGTAFPFAVAGGPAILRVQTTYTAGDNNQFGSFTLTSQLAINLGLRAPVVLGVTASEGNCGFAQDLIISGHQFILPNGTVNVNQVFAVELDNPANVINATSFVVLNRNLIDAFFNFGAANTGKTFLIFASGPNGTSRNLVESDARPEGVPIGNEQGNQVTFRCAVVADLVEVETPNVDVAEGCASALINITRHNPSSGSVTVDFQTNDGTALQKSDYTATFGTLTFGPGETTKTIAVPITADAFVEGNETFTVTLSNPTGGTSLGGQSTATVTIIDDDVAPSMDNPIDDAETFVCQNYHDFLNRDPDPAGLAFWADQITDCGTDADCITARRTLVSAAFFLSIEFQETGFYVIRTQRAAFGSKSNEATTRVPYFQFLRDAQQVGRGVIVGQAGFEDLLEQNKQAYAMELVTSAAFEAQYPLALTAEQFVDALFATAMVTPTMAERDAAIAAFGGGGTAGRVAAFRSVADAESLRNAEFNAAFVLMQYHGYLRRGPTDPPDSDDSGYQFWLDKLNSFGGDFVAAEMVKAFISSTEYRERFGQP